MASAMLCCDKFGSQRLTKKSGQKFPLLNSIVISPAILPQFFNIFSP
jgi:hypothetical protein